MNFINKIQNKSFSTRYLILIVGVTISMAAVVYLWTASFSQSLGGVSLADSTDVSGADVQKNSLELISLKDNLKASVSDFVSVFSGLKNQFDGANSQPSNVSYTKPAQDNENGAGQSKVLKFPSNY